MLNRLFGWVQGKEKPPITYDQEKELASGGDDELRADLASRKDARPEILYFLPAHFQKSRECTHLLAQVQTFLHIFKNRL